MNIASLRCEVRRFRQAFDACHRDLDVMIFGSFPRGCCGAVSELLAVFLKAKGYGAFTYVCGLRFEDDFRPLSHAWLEQGGFIVDVTQDQFDECSEPAFVTNDRSWHDSQFPEQKKQEHFGELSQELCFAYARVRKEVESASNIP